MRDKLHIYCRVSSRSQETDGESLEFQKKLGIEKSNQLNMTPVIYNEGGKSSDNDDISERPQLQSLLTNIEKGEVDNVWCFETSRMFRTETIKYIILSIIKKHKVKLYVRDTEYDLNDPTLLFMFNVMGSVNKLENDLRKERSRLGKLSKLKKGGWKGGTVPFGYKVVDSMIEVDDKEKEWIRRIFEWYSRDKSLLFIKSELDRSGVQTRLGKGKKSWTLGTIRKMLGNTMYRGVMRYFDSKEEKTYVFKYPSIIDDKTFNIVQSKFTRFQRSYRNQFNKTQNFYMLRDIMFCHCGNNMKGRIIRSKGNEVSVYYCDIRRKVWKENQLKEEMKWKRGVFCKNDRSMNIGMTDKVVWESVIDVIRNSNLLKEEFKSSLVSTIQKNRDVGLEKVRQLKKSLKELDKKIEDCNNKIDGIDSSLIMGDGKYVVNGIEIRDVGGVRKKIEEEKNKFENMKNEKFKDIEDIENSKKWINWIEKFDKRYGDRVNFSDKDKKEIIENFVERIEVGYDKDKKLHNIDLKFKLPVVDDKRVKNKDNVIEIVKGNSSKKLREVSVVNLGGRKKVDG